MAKQKAAYEATSFEELSKLVELETVKKALKAFETSRLAHKQYYLRRQTILAKAREAGITAE
jgi:ribulose bisphosphate carboxylase small subunit